MSTGAPSARWLRRGTVSARAFEKPLLRLRARSLTPASARPTVGPQSTSLLLRVLRVSVLITLRVLRSLRDRQRIGALEHDVLLEPRDFLFVHVLADLPPELLDRLVQADLLELVEHPFADAGDAEDLLVGRRVKIDRDEHLPVDVGRLLLREPLLFRIAVTSVMLLNGRRLMISLAAAARRGATFWSCSSVAVFGLSSASVVSP